MVVFLFFFEEANDFKIKLRAVLKASLYSHRCICPPVFFGIILSFCWTQGGQLVVANLVLWLAETSNYPYSCMGVYLALDHSFGAFSILWLVTDNTIFLFRVFVWCILARAAISCILWPNVYYSPKDILQMLYKCMYKIYCESWTGYGDDVNEFITFLPLTSPFLALWRFIVMCIIYGHICIIMTFEIYHDLHLKRLAAKHFDLVYL